MKRYPHSWKPYETITWSYSHPVQGSFHADLHLDHLVGVSTLRHWAGSSQSVTAPRRSVISLKVSSWGGWMTHPNLNQQLAHMESSSVWIHLRTSTYFIIFLYDVWIFLYDVWLIISQVAIGVWTKTLFVGHTLQDLTHVFSRDFKPASPAPDPGPARPCHCRVCTDSPHAPAAENPGMIRSLDGLIHLWG